MSWIYCYHRYGAILSINSVAEILAALVFGAWADRRPFKEPTLSMYVFCWLRGVQSSAYMLILTQYPL